MTYEYLQKQYEQLNIQELDLSDVSGLKGLCLDDNIAIEKTLTRTEKTCILAEELGHYHTTTGDILDQTDVSNRKQERHARIWAYDKLIGLSGIIRAFERPCETRYEFAEFLGVTEGFLQEALDCYAEKYSPYIDIDGYRLMFKPYLAVFKKI